MSLLFQTGLSNAVIASGIALFVMLLTFKSKRPAWTHALWVLVLIKLVTPPLVWFDSELPSLAGMQAVEISPSIEQPFFEGNEMGMMSEAFVPLTHTQVNQPAAQHTATNNWDWAAKSWLPILSTVWIVGTIWMLVRYSMQWTTVRRWINQGKRASSPLRSNVLQVAGQIGLRRVPRVVLVPQIVTPSIFAMGNRSTLVLPERLIDQVDDEELQTIIAHELIHLRRGDGWVRLLELLSSALFWWHPIVPWVRHKIHQAAEEACDAWVTSILPEASRAYASAMVKTVDFLSADESDSRPLVTGMGDIASLARRMRRMRRISVSPSSPSVSWTGRISLAFLAITLLPLGFLTLPESTAQQPPVAQDDPFGGGDDNDPSGNDPSGNDPSGNDPSGNDPSGNDPSGSDPSGSDPSGSDPFGDGVTRKPQVTAPQLSLKIKALTAPNGIDPDGAEAALRKKLSQKTSIEAVNAALSDVVEILHVDSDVPLLIDLQSLEEIGLTPDIPVTISLKNVSLRSALRIMLKPFDLTYMIKDEVIQITTREAAENNLTFRAYALPAVLKDKMDKVATALTATVSPDAWDGLGGPCSLSLIDNVMVVSGTEDIHAQVDEFIRKVEAAFLRRIETDEKADAKANGKESS